MKRKIRQLVSLLLFGMFTLTVGVTLRNWLYAAPTRPQFRFVFGQNPSPAPTPAKTQTPTPITVPPETSTPESVRTPQHHTPDLDNGIVVGETKIYDDKSLRQLLNTLQQNLADLRFINQGAIAGGLGRFQGERQDMSSFGLNLTTSPLPSIATTTNTGITSTFDQITSQPSVPANSPVPSASVQTTIHTVSPNTIQEVVTQPQQNAAAAALPGQSSAFTAQQPTGLSGQDLLAEQVSLQYQVMDLQLLLNQATSDKVLSFQSGPTSLSGRRAETVIGFQISLNSPDAHKNQVAEVEIEITTRSAEKAPSLVFLLPRDKTYNVAAVTKDAKQIGLGAILGVLNVGVSAGKSKETLYLVAQTDTVALEKIHPTNETLNKKALTISWQFRPVLGQQTVKAGPRQVFALVALPVLEQNQEYKASVRAYTRWRRYNMKAQSVGDVIDGSESYRDFLDIGPDSGAAKVVLAPQVQSVNWSDTGSGQVLVTVQGENFVPGTTALVGSTVLSRPDNGLNLQDENTMLLLIPEQKFSQADNVLLVAPTGVPTEVVASAKSMFEPLSSGEGLCPKPEGWGLKIKNVKVEPFDAQNSTVTFELVNRDGTASKSQQPRVYSLQKLNNVCQQSEKPITPIAVVGASAFGFKDVPLKRLTKPDDTAEKFSFVVSSQVLRNAGKVIIKQPFLGEDYFDQSAVSIPGDFTASQIITLASGEEHVQLAVAGTGFNRCLPIAVTLGTKAFYRAMDTDSGCKSDNDNPAVTVFLSSLPAPGSDRAPLKLHGTTLLTLAAEQKDFKGLKQVFVEQAGAPAQMLALATPPPIPDPVIDKQDTLLEGDSKTIQLSGSNFGSTGAASFEGVDLKPKPADDGKTMFLTIPSSLTQKAGDKEINITLKNGAVKKYTLKVDKRP